MNADRFERISELFDAATELPSESREAWLREACGDDGELLDEVRSLLEHHVAEAQPLESGTSGEVARSLANEAAQLESALPEVPGYTVTAKIGEGGMGAVYEAQQLSPRRTVALKILRPSLNTDEMRRRFEREEEALARLQHPGIAQIHDAGVVTTDAGPLPYYAMERIHGRPLDEYAEEHDLDLEGRLLLLAAVCDAVQHAHLQGVIHRDLKPSNILVDEAGRPKVLDFGVARVTDSDVQMTTLQTNVGQLVGTLSYMSPEQAAGDPSSIDMRSDVYSLGVIAYELLAGQLPHDLAGKSIPEAVRILTEEVTTHLGSVNRALRGDVETIVAKALETDRDRRYASAAGLATDLRRYMNHEPIVARPPSVAYQLKKFARRNKVLVGATGVVFLALVAAVAFSTRFALSELRQRRIAEEQSYNATIREAFRAFADHRIHTAWDLLQSAPPEARNWEWDYLRERLDAVESAHELEAGAAPVLFAGFVRGTRDAFGIDSDNRAHLWNRDTGDRAVVELADPLHPDQKAYPLAVSPDGRHVLSGFLGPSEAVLWNLRTGEVRHRLPRQGQIDRNPSAISAGLRWVALATNIPAVFDLDSNSRVTSLPVRNGAFSSDGSLFVIPLRSKLAFLDTHTGDWARAPIEIDLAGQRVALSPDSTMVAVSDTDRLATYDVESGQRLAVMPRRTGSLTFAPDGTVVELGPTIRHLDPRTGQELRQLRNGRREARGTPGEYSWEGPYLATAFEDGSRHGVQIWATDTDPLVLRGHDDYVYPVAFSPDGEWIASGSYDDTVRLWDAASGEAVARFPACDWPYDLTFDPDGSRLLGASSSGFGSAWSTRTGELLTQLPGKAFSLAFSPDGSLLLRGVESAVEVLDGRTLQLVERLDDMGESSSLVFSPDGMHFAGANSSTRSVETVTIWSTSAREPRVLGRAPSPSCAIAFAPDSSRLVTGHRDGTLLLWSTGPEASGPLGVLTGHVGEVFDVLYLNDDRIASGGRDGKIRIWSAKSARELAVLEGHTAYVYSLALSPDGRRLVSGSGDGTVRIWETTPFRAREQARRASASRPPEADAWVEARLARGDEPADVFRSIHEELASPLHREARHSLLRATEPLRTVRPWEGAPVAHVRLPDDLDPHARPNGENRVLVLPGDGAVRVEPVEAWRDLASFTLECWARGEDPENRSALIANTNDSGFGIYWADPLPHGRAPHGVVHLDGLLYSRVGPPAWTWGEWTHLALTFDGSRLSFFLNGTESASRSLSGTPTWSSWPLYVGADPGDHGEPISFFCGAIDEVRLSDVVRYDGTFEPAQVHEPDEHTLLLLHFDSEIDGFHADDSSYRHHGRAVGEVRLERER